MVATTPPPVAAVSRTAKDALQAKYSAVAIAGYQPDPTVSSKKKDDNDSYRFWLERVAVAANATRRQTPLVNAGYAMRVTCLLDHIDTFLRFHHQQHRQVNLVVLGAGLDVTGLWALEQQQQSAVDDNAQAPQTPNAPVTSQQQQQRQEDLTQNLVGTIQSLIYQHNDRLLQLSSGAAVEPGFDTG